MITEDFKKRVIEAIAEYRKNFGPNEDVKCARSLGIDKAQYSRIMSGELDKVISEGKWISIGRRLDVPILNLPKWNTAATKVFKAVSAQLEWCQQYGNAAILCDIPDIGKTYAARCYVKTNSYAKYIDCSQVKTKQKLVRAIAKEFGTGCTGTYADVYADLVFYLNSIPGALIILDEGGDLNYDAFLELKALWNATEHHCGWYLMGADGLKAKILRGIEYKKVGFAEIYSRFGARIQKISPDGAEELKEFKTAQTAAVMRENWQGGDEQKMIAGSDGSLRRIYIEISKRRTA